MRSEEGYGRQRERCEWGLENETQKLEQFCWKTKMKRD
jgi:hypothetical protein